jgi:hypothetical protein
MRAKLTATELLRAQPSSVYVSQTADGGANWRLFGTGLPTVNVSDLYMPTDGSYLRVSTYGRGVWEVRY